MTTIAVESTTDVLRRIWEQYAAQKDTRAERHKTLRKLASTILEQDNLVVMDTETTGLGSDDEVVEIAAISGAGDTLLHTLIRPTRPIPADATKVHGIGNTDVRDAPTMREIAPSIARVLEGKFVAVYNAEFDFRLLWQSMERTNAKPKLRRMSRKQQAADVPGVVAVESACVMRLYAAWNGDKWSSGTFVWQKLTDAVNGLGLDYGGRAHGALSDARATLAVLRHMAGA